MPTTPAMNVLSSPVRRQILAVLLLHPERQWRLLDLADRFDSSSSDLRLELRRLVREGVLCIRQEESKIHYQTNPACPLLPELRRLLLTRTELVDILLSAVEQFAGRISVAFVFGPCARADPPWNAGIDLLIVGDAGPEEMAPAVSAAAGRMGTPIAPKIDTRDGFTRKLRAADRELIAAIDHDKLFVIGGPDELARLIEAADEPPPVPRAAVIHARFRRGAFATAVTGFGVLISSTRFYPLAIDDGPAPPPPAPMAVSSGLDPNTAAWYELAQLPGIGENIARHIVEHRENQRREKGDRNLQVYRNPADLQAIRGIGERTVRRLTPFLRFSTRPMLLESPTELPTEAGPP